MFINLIKGKMKRKPIFIKKNVLIKTRHLILNILKTFGYIMDIENFQIF
jgi:hypothetical protein